MSRAYEVFDKFDSTSAEERFVRQASILITVDLDDYMPLTLSMINENKMHRPITEVIKDDAVNYKPIALWNSPLHHERRNGLWLTRKREVTARGQNILAGKISGDIANAYTAYMSKNVRNRGGILLSNAIKVAELAFPDKARSSQIKLAVAICYSAVRESNLNPMIGEISSRGTGVGLIQWSFSRQDDVFANMAKYAQPGYSSMDVFPSVTLQTAFILKELVKVESAKKNKVSKFDLMMKEGVSVEEVIIRFLHVTMGSQFDARCMNKSVIPRSVQLINLYDFMPLEFRVTTANLKAVAASPEFRGNGTCPNAPNYGR